MRNLLLHKLTCLQVTILEERLCSLTSLQFFVQVPAINFIESININITSFIALTYYKLGNQQLLLETHVCDHNLNC